jgi:hypothetical protein
MTFGGMGSQKLDAPNIEYIVNNDTHPGAQFNDQFRSIVKNELARVSALDNLQTAQAKLPRPTSLAKLPPPKDGKSNALAFASTDSAKRDRSRHEQARPVPISVEQRPQPKPVAVFAEAPAPQPIFAEALSSSANAQPYFMQRTLTISDMKDYVKRNYPSSQTPDVTR